MYAPYVNAHAKASSQSESISDRPVTSKLQLKESLRGLSFDEQVAALSPVQRQGNDSPAQGVQAAAAQGVSGSAGTLPYADKIQAAFGSHDISNIQAYQGGNAAGACDAIGAEAYATGSSVGFKGAPTLHTAAHEAAHIVQQRAGVSLKGGVGKAGDQYEQHADAVADAVVQGKSAEGILDGMAGPATSAGSVQEQSVQRLRSHTPGNTDCMVMEGQKYCTNSKGTFEPVKNAPTAQHERADKAKYETEMASLKARWEAFPEHIQDRVHGRQNHPELMGWDVREDLPEKLELMQAVVNLADKFSVNEEATRMPDDNLAPEADGPTDSSWQNEYTKVLPTCKTPEASPDDKKAGPNKLPNVGVNKGLSNNENSTTTKVGATPTSVNGRYSKELVPSTVEWKIPIYGAPGAGIWLSIKPSIVLSAIADAKFAGDEAGKTTLKGSVTGTVSANFKGGLDCANIYGGGSLILNIDGVEITREASGELSLGALNGSLQGKLTLGINVAAKLSDKSTYANGLYLSSDAAEFLRFGAHSWSESSGLLCPYVQAGADLQLWIEQVGAYLGAAEEAWEGIKSLPESAEKVRRQRNERVVEQTGPGSYFLDKSNGL